MYIPCGLPCRGLLLGSFALGQQLTISPGSTSQLGGLTPSSICPQETFSTPSPSLVAQLDASYSSVHSLMTSPFQMLLCWAELCLLRKSPLLLT